MSEQGRQLEVRDVGNALDRVWRLTAESGLLSTRKCLCCKCRVGSRPAAMGRP